MRDMGYGSKWRLALLAGSLLLAGCASQVKNKAAAVLTPDPYERLAEKISDAHGRLANNKVAVLPFSYTDKRASYDGVIVSERLLTRIAGKGELQVIERGLLEKVLGELKFQRSGAVDEGSIKGLGKILGVEAVVTGTLTGRSDGRVEINVRLIKTESAAVLAAASEAVLPDWRGSGGPVPAPASLPAPQPAPQPASQPAPLPAAAAVDARKCPKGMVAYWNFDAISGTETPDVFGGMKAGLDGGFRPARGKVNSALDLSSSGTFYVGDRPELRIRKGITLEAWVKYRSINFSESGSKILCSGRSYCFVIGGAEQHSSRLLVDMDGLSTPSPYQGNAVLAPDTWYHAAVTYDGSRITIYLNGKVDAAFGAAGLLQPGSRGVTMGRSPDAVAGYGAPLDGLLDEVAVYGRALGPGEIAAHYRMGLSGKGYCSI